VQQKEMARVGIILGIISMVMGYGLLYLIGMMHVL
jgi:sodium-dependent dicarboxylate transporter 2/3/5